MLSRLTVVIGGFSLETAEAIAGGGPGDVIVVDALEELIDAGLIVEDHGDGEPRYRLLEPINQHVTMRLAPSNRSDASHRHPRWFTQLAGAVGAGSVSATFGLWADVVETELANFRLAHRWAIETASPEQAVQIVDGLAVVGHERGLLELADWCDATVAIVNGRHDRQEVAALAAAVGFWWLQNRAHDIQVAVERVEDAPGEAEHHLALCHYAIQTSLHPDHWRDAIGRLEKALARYGSDQPTWRTAQSHAYLVLLGGLDATAVVPIATRLDSPVFSAMFTFYRAVPFYMTGDEATAAELAGQAVALSRSAGAVIQLGVALMGQGGWRAQLPDATLADVFGPQAESLDLWDRLRVAWGIFAVAEEIAQALAIRGFREEAFVLWGAVDKSGIRPPSMVGRRSAAPYITDIPHDQATAWQAQGATMTADELVAYARKTLAAVLA